MLHANAALTPRQRLRLARLVVEDGWKVAVVQTCVVHLIRASMRYVSWSDHKAMTAALRADLPRPDRAGRGAGPGGV